MQATKLKPQYLPRCRTFVKPISPAELSIRNLLTESRPKYCGKYERGQSKMVMCESQYCHDSWLINKPDSLKFCPT